LGAGAYRDSESGGGAVWGTEARKDWKFKLTRLLYERGYGRQDIINLFRFVDWILELPEDLKRSFRDELEEYERERQMPYVTSIASGTLRERTDGYRTGYRTGRRESGTKDRA
jgi:hypothetical protein